jgi:hypothetical protein
MTVDRPEPPPAVPVSGVTSYAVGPPRTGRGHRKLQMRSPKDNMMRTILVLACALVAGLAVYPATGAAQAVKEEYDLGPLPQANGDNETTGGGAATTSDSDDDGGGGASPVLLIVLGVTALACLSVAAWWMRRDRGGQGPGGTSASNESTNQAPSSAGSATSATSTSTPS